MKQIGLALALAVSIPVVVSGTSAEPVPRGLSEGHAGYGVITLSRTVEAEREPTKLLGLVECSVSLFGESVRPPALLEGLLCPREPIVYLTDASAPNPRDHVLTPTGFSLRPVLDGVPYPVVEELVYEDASGARHYAWRTHVLANEETHWPTGRSFNLVGVVNPDAVAPGAVIRAWVEGS